MPPQSPSAIHPELLQFDGFLDLPYWNGPYPLHAATTVWQDKAIYFVGQCNLNVGAPKKYPFKPVVVVLTRKNMVIFKASDLTLCRRITFDTVGAVYSNAREPTTHEAPHTGFAGSTSGRAAVESTTGFLILKESAATAADASSSSSVKKTAPGNAADVVGWGGDIAIQGPKAMMRDLLPKFMTLVCNAKRLVLTDADGTAFGAALPQASSATSGGHVIVDLCRSSETSLLDTTVSYAPPLKTTDPRLAFQRMEHLMIPRALVAERYLIEHPEWQPAAVVAEQKAKEAEEERKKGVPWCATARRVADLQSQPSDFLPPVVVDAKSEALYRPIGCIAALWCGRLALAMPSAADEGGEMTADAARPMVVCAFVTNAFLYLACNEFDIIRCIPVDAIRSVLIEEKLSRRRTASFSPSSPIAAPRSPSEVHPEATRVRTIMFYYALAPAASAAVRKEKAEGSVHGFGTTTGSGSGSGWTWEAQRMTLEFETQAQAMSFFEALKSVAPDSWRVDQLKAEFMESQLEEESARLVDALRSPRMGGEGVTPSSSTRPPPTAPEGGAVRSPLLIGLWCPMWKRTVHMQWIAFRVRLFAFYETYCPHKLNRVDKVVWQWKGESNGESNGEYDGCEEVMGTLCRKYGKEPDVSLQDVVQLLVEQSALGGGRNMSNNTLSISDPSSRDRSPTSPTEHVVAAVPSIYGRTSPPAAALVGDTQRSLHSRGSSFQGIPRVLSVPSMRSGQSNKRADTSEKAAVTLTSGALEQLSNPQVVSRSEVVARTLGKTFLHQSGAAQDEERPSGSPGAEVHRILSATSMGAAASATSPQFGSTIGDVLRSFAFSVTYFDRFATMYFPSASGINSSCDEPEKVLTFQRLIHAYAPNEDSFYAALIQRAEQRRSGGNNVTMSSADVASPTSRVVHKTDTRQQPLGAYDEAYEPAERSPGAPRAPASSFHVDPTAWAQRKGNGADGESVERGAVSAATMLRRYHTQSLASPAPYGQGRSSRHDPQNYLIADDDLKAAMLEPLSSSVHFGSDQNGSVSLSMLPPVFSAKRPDAYLSHDSRRTTRVSGPPIQSSGPFRRV